MSRRQIGCGATALYTVGEREFLMSLSDASHQVETLNWCDLEPGHPGLHFTIAQQTPGVEWWLCWDIADRAGRDLKAKQPCPAKDVPDDGGESEPCLLATGHAGDHGFAFDVADLPADQRPPVLVPRQPDWDRLTGLQRENHEVLRAHGLTAPVYVEMMFLQRQETQFGIVSTDHLGFWTSQPVPQLARMDATTLGLAAGVALGHLDVIEEPPYDPLSSSKLYSDSVVVSLTPAGRNALAEVEPLLQG